MRSTCYYKAIKEILKYKYLIYNKQEPGLTSLVALKSLQYEGINIEYTDRKIRQYYPIIYGIIADYKEQVLITNIKTQQHYIIY